MKKQNENLNNNHLVTDISLHHVCCEFKTGIMDTIILILGLNGQNAIISEKFTFIYF